MTARDATVPPRKGQTRRIAELSTLYEIARSLLGAHGAPQIASRLVLSGMGALGVRSGAMFTADERGRLRLLHAAGLEEPTRGAVLAVPDAAREWMLRRGAFVLDAAAARALGPLRDQLVGRYDAAVGAAVADAQGLAGLLVFGPGLLPGSSEDLLEPLESVASLAATALRAAPVAAASGTTAKIARPERSLEEMRREHPALRSMIGVSAALLETCGDLLSVAATRFPVLLLGESGSGKELAARALHELSDRADGPFEVADCSSIPRELIESELFGHVRGAFTGAHRDRRGAFELAHRGTLFLDEIGEMPLQLQTRLLRVLQEGRFRRVGDEHPLEADVRVVAATHRDLKAEVSRRRFREDLYYRLNVFAIRVPPLRDRIEDLGPLARHFLERQAKELGGRSWKIDDEVVRALERHAWPGNVRELANLCAGVAVRSRENGHVTLDVLQHVWRRQHPGEDPPWSGTAGAPRGRLGDWVLEQARTSRFNLIEAARTLKRRQRAGQPVALSERSALAYYLNGEILKALVAADGDPDVAARAVAGDEELTARVAVRVQKLCAALRAIDDRATLRRRFAKLPVEYGTALERAHRLIGSA